MKHTIKDTDKNQAIADLQELFDEVKAPENAHADKQAMLTVYCVIRSVAKSGMSRTMTLFVIRNGIPHYITRDVCLACGYTYTKDGNLKVSGCGMDMGHDVVYRLSIALFGNEGSRTLTHRWL